MISNYLKKLPKKRMGAGALVLDQKNRIVIVNPSYKKQWALPGGVVEKNESPKKACEREVEEELGIKLKVTKLLCIDYISRTKQKNENLQFVFYCGKLNKNQIAKIKVPKDELLGFRFVDIKTALKLLRPKIRRRLPKCIKALNNNTTAYLENGR